MIFLHIRKHFGARTSEWILACILASWGLMLLRPENTFLDERVYLTLTRIASETVWGWMCLGCGLLRIAALIVNGSWVPSTYHLRSLTSILSCFFWFQITLGLMASGVASTGLAIYPWLLVLDVICCHRAAVDLRFSQAAVKHATGE